MGFSYAYECVLLYVLAYVSYHSSTDRYYNFSTCSLILQSAHCHQRIKGIKLRAFFTHSLISTILACSRHVILFIVK